MTHDTTTLPSVPRELTPRVRRRAWLEPRVRFWLLLAGVLLIVGFLFVIQGIHARYHDAWLIRNGVHIDALITNADGETLQNRPYPGTGAVQIEFPWKNNPKYSPQMRQLEGRQYQDSIYTGVNLLIHVNPEDPEDWTWLNKPLSMLSQMIGGIVVLPLGILVLLWALSQQRSTLRIWRDGQVVQALIVESRNSAIAPSSRVARATPADENDLRIYTIYLPAQLASLKAGEPVTLLRLGPSGKAACAAAWFE